MRKLLFLFLMCFTLNASAISAKAFIVTNLDGTVLAEKNADSVRSIASITKLATAQNAIKLDPNELVMITRYDFALRSAHSILRVGRAYSRNFLIQLALIHSDNVAAHALGRTNIEPVVALPDKMKIVEPTGLDPNNVATARALASLARNLYNTDLAEISSHSSVGGIRSTNPLIGKDGWVFHLSKTGWINQSGGCMVVIFDMNNKPTVVVLLGATSVKQRWRDLYDLRKQFDKTRFAKP